MPATKDRVEGRLEERIPLGAGELAPRGKATAFLATNALTSGLAATVAPILAGALA